MKPKVRACLGPFLIFCCIAASGQVSSNRPAKSENWRPIGIRSLGSLDDDMLRNAVRQEILETDIVQLITKAANLTEHEKSLLQVGPDSSKELAVYQLTKEWTPGCDQFEKHLKSYVRLRGDGHTVECLFEGLTNRPSSITNLDLAILTRNSLFLPMSWFKRLESGTTTNKAGSVKSERTTETVVDGKRVRHPIERHIAEKNEICRWTSYVISDGGFAWKYVMSFNADESLDHIFGMKYDGKDFDPKYKAVMDEVDKEIVQEMNRSGTNQQMGAVVGYWYSKKFRLKLRGIDWRSPTELNPGMVID